MEITKQLIIWYESNKRPLPWRLVSDPYKIWVSEIILQQTRVDQGLDYYHRFLETFPDLASLAEAEEQQVLQVWQGLGYYSRARYMHQAARTIMGRFRGEFPESYEDILKLKGIGQYTASAIASIAFRGVYPVLDGNVYRVITRLFGIHAPVNDAGGQREVMGILHGLIDKDDPGTFNQAIMEFGALHCTPRKPSCSTCIFRAGCKALINGETELLPVKAKKIKVVTRYFNYLVIISSKNPGITYMRKRTADDIWRNLFDFPLIESRGPLSQGQLSGSDEWKAIFSGIHVGSISRSRVYKHKLTHREIHCLFNQIIINEEPAFNDPDIISVPLDKIRDLPVSRLVEQYLDDHENSL